MRLETQIQILPVDLPLHATARKVVLDTPYLVDGYLPVIQPDGSTVELPFRKINYTTLIFFGRLPGAIPGSFAEEVFQRVTVIGAESLVDAINVLNREVVSRAAANDIPMTPDCGFFGWDFAPTAVRALVHIQEA